MARLGRWLLCSWSISLIAAGCSLVLDMPTRELDPTFVDAGSGSDASAECIAYCNDVSANCVGANAVYASSAVCLATCSQLPPGAPDASTGNTVGCRAQQANYALTTGEFGSSCPPAGPGGGSADPEGGSVCGSNCEGYCTLMMANCSYKFDSYDACMSACAIVPDLGGFNIAIQTGNSIQCRLYHVTAATQDPAVHCVHASGDKICK